eukprot:1152702-Karenia_brevis.AAC.1
MMSTACKKRQTLVRRRLMMSTACKKGSACRNLIIFDRLQSISFSAAIVVYEIRMTDVISFSAAISAVWAPLFDEISCLCSALGTAVCAQHWAPLFDEMRIFDVISFSAAISACEKDGQWQRVATILGKMTRAELVDTILGRYPEFQRRHA